MKANSGVSPADFIVPLTVDGLRGRMIYKPSVDPAYKRNILFIYGQHSSLERWWGLVQELSRYGAVTVPDLPGYGGMDSLYKIGKEPTFDELADYLADFITEQYKSKRFSLLGLSIGFAIVTRMLERHPELTERIELLVSVVGFAHHEDFVFSRRRRNFYVSGSKFFSIRPLDKVLQHVFFNPALLRRVYHRTLNAKEKFEALSGDEFARTMDMEVELWRINDLRTWMRCNVEMFNLDNTKAKVDLPVLHLSVRKDRYFDLKRVEKHYKQIFSGYEHVQLPTDSHGPSVIATADEAAVLIPPVLRRMLGK